MIADRAIRNQLISLVRDIGGLDAAAAALREAGASRAVDPKSTLSRVLSGHARIDVIEVAALEEAAGRYPITRRLAARLPEEAE